MQKYMPSSQFNCYLIIITITIVDRKSTRLNSSHLGISYAVFCLKKKSTRLNSSHLGISYAVFCLKKKKISYTQSCVERWKLRSLHGMQATGRYTSVLYTNSATSACSSVAH